jgi:type I restriction enzyme S subunit
MPVKTPPKKQPYTIKQAKAIADKLLTKSVMTPAAISNEGLPDGWRWVKLGDIALKSTSKVLPTEYPNAKFIGMDCIEPHTLKPSFTYQFNEFKSSGNFFEKGQVLYGRMRPYLNKVYRAEFDGTCSGEFIVLKCFPNFSPDLLTYILHSRNFVRFANHKTSGDRPRISYEEIADYQIALPPIDHQHAIVSKIEELLSELDKGKQQLETAQQQLKIYRQAVLKWAFEGKLTNENVKEGKLPKGWTIFKLGDITINFDGKRIPLSRDVRATRKGEYRYYGATEVVDHIDDYIFDGVYLLIGEDGANLLTKSRPLAFIAEGKFWVNNHAHVLQAKENLVLKYLLNYFNSINLGQYVTGSAQPKLTQANLNKIPVPIPTIEEQQLIIQEIESRLSVCDKVEETITTSLAQAETLRQSILKKAFEGKLV